MEIIYQHYGKIGDIWKHLPLCNVISIENPNIYIETNSACYEYSLAQTDEQKYGIYNFMDKAVDFQFLMDSEYYKVIYPFVNKDRYLGSPGLAVSLMKDSADKFIFFDTNIAALDNIQTFAIQNNLTEKINVFHQDSVIGLFDLLPNLPNSTLIHIDPYYIDKESSNGKTYMDLFIKASEQGLKCFLWYGFNTLDDKNQLNDYIKTKLVQSNISSTYCSELIMEVIQKNSIVCNPGILGCGILTSNLSKDSYKVISEYSDLLIDLYKGTNYCGFKGDLYQDIIINNVI
jgi:23S rRNA (adenine2030-N6)-methyltransferase